jgi:lipoprotein-anchoring transpeptidase ErfK/SrfK
MINAAQGKRVAGLLLAPVFLLAGLFFVLRSRSAEAASPVRLEVSLSARELKVIENGHVTKTYGVAVGRPSHPTPTGSYRTGDIDWNPAWTPPNTDWAKNKKPQPPGAPSNPLQGVKIYFRAPDYYIHGTNDPGSIGEAASHGCIRMTSADAKALARRIESAGGSVPLLIRR